MVSIKEIRRRLRKSKLKTKNKSKVENYISSGGYNPPEFICPKCNLKNPPYADFCQYCGLKVVSCPLCNSKNSESSKICSNCGKYMKEDYYIKKGLELLNNGEYFEANLIFEKLLEDVPNNYQAWYHRGKSLSHINEYDKALECFDNALRHGIPSKTNIWMNKGIILEKINRPDDAAVCFNEILYYDYPEQDIPDNTIQNLMISTSFGSSISHIPENQLIEVSENKKKSLLKMSKYKKEELLSNDNFIFIQNFVKRYGVEYDESELELLRTLLISKDTEIRLDLLELMIINEFKLQEFNEFKNKIYYNQPSTIKDIIVNFLDLYGENHPPRYKDLFYRVLKEKGEEISEEQFITIVSEINQDRKLQNFESELLEQTYFGENPFLDINDLNNLNGYEFEYVLKILFNKMGYKTQNTPLSGDQGADLIIIKFGEITVVQAKLYSNKVPNTAVQEVVASIKHYKAHKGMVVTNNEFTNSAIELANSNNIELIDEYKLKNLLNMYKISKKEIDRIKL